VSNAIRKIADFLDSAPKGQKMKKARLVLLMCATEASSTRQTKY